MSGAAATSRMTTAAQILDRLFVGRRDTYGRFDPETGRGVNVKEPLTERLLLDHVYGRIQPVGVYPVVLSDGVCRSGWFCIDIDRDGDYDDARTIARKILDAARPVARLIPERSKGKGIHLWCFHENVETWKARALGRFLLRLAAVPEGTEEKGREVTVFPKQDQVKPGEYGNFVFLPWQGGKVRDGRSAFLDYDTLEPLADQVAGMAECVPVPAATVERVIAANNLQPSNVKPIERPKSSAPATPEAARPQRTTGAAQPGELSPLSEDEFNRLVDMSGPLTSAVRTPGSCAYKDWFISLMHMVPFSDGKARAQLFSSADGKRFKADGFNGFEMYWDSAVKTYLRDHSTAPRWSQRVVDDWRMGGARVDVEPINSRYGFYKGCLVERNWSIADGNRIETKPTILTNFEARITAQEYLDDGTGTTERVVRVEGKLSTGRRLPPAEVPAVDWPEIEKWIAKRWGTDPIIWVDGGKSRTARTKEAIALTGHSAPSRRVITHTGWVQHEGRWAFLTNGRITGCPREVADAIRRDADIRLPEELGRYTVPEDTTDELARKAYDWIEKFARCAEQDTTAPLIAAMFLAPLKHFLPIDLAIAIVGKTGTRKSSLVAAILSAYSETGFSRQLPVSFRSTSNFIERVSFSAKDLPLVVDNYVPDRRGIEQEKVERLAHSVGDGASRGRMRADESISYGKPARGVVIITGEDLPQGSSSVARFYVVTRGNSDNLHLCALGDVQDAAARGELAPAMTHYIGWLARQLEDKSFLPRLTNMYQELSRDGMNDNPEHGRLAEQSAWVRVGLRLAQESHPAGAWQLDGLHTAMTKALDRQCRVRGVAVRESSLSYRFISAITSAVDMGLLRGVRPQDGCKPVYNPVAWGWHDDETIDGHPLHAHAHGGVYIERDHEDPKRWYLSVRPSHIMTFLREKLPASINFSESHLAVGNALDADGLLLDQEPPNRGPKLQTTAGRVRVWKIDGNRAWRMLGRED